MKRLFKSIIVALIISTLLSFLPFEQECKAISEKVLRIHILADSDSTADQNLKLMVRDAVLKYTEGLYSSVNSKEEAVSITQSHMDEIIKVAEDVLNANGCSDSVSAELADAQFNTRYYEKITMPSGSYAALRIKIGSGKGHNWWCVMYPSLCLYSCENTKNMEEELTDKQFSIVTSDGKYEFKFKFLEYFNKVCGFFS